MTTLSDVGRTNSKISVAHLRSQWEACSQPKGMSSQTLHSASVQVQEMRTVPLTFVRKNVVKRNSCKNRNDIASQPIDIEWHVFSVTLMSKYYKNFKYSSWKLVHEPGSLECCSPP